MKLILLLAAIYSLIFYQEYKIQRSKASTPQPGARIVRTDLEPAFRDQHDFKTANLLIKNNDIKMKQRPITKAGFYQ
jgi:hypothetical protein